MKRSIREIQYSVLSEGETCQVVTSALGCLSPESPVVVFRNLRSHQRDLEEWSLLLRDQCQWTLDRRHISADARMTSMDWWEISNNAGDPTTFAYSATAQPLHTDNAWFKNPAEVTFFLMYRQATVGGQQTLISGLELIQALRDDDPLLLEELMTKEVSVQKDVNLAPHVAPILQVQPTLRLTWNYFRTDRSRSDVASLCERFRTYLEHADDRGLVREVLLTDGDAMAILDSAVLHGRREFHVDKPRDRILYQSMWFNTQHHALGHSSQLPITSR